MASKRRKPGSSLDEQLHFLNLPFARQHFDELVQQAAREEWSHVQYLTRLIEGEAAYRQERSTQRRIRNARFPMIKTFEQFDFTWPSKINRMKVKDLFRLRFIDEHANVLLIGGVGMGKTHLAIALGVKAVEAGHKVLFLPLETMMSRLVRARQENRVDRQLQTSNKSFVDWGEIFNDQVLATAILDRLLHHSTTLNIKGESYRLKEKRKAGLLGTEPKVNEPRKTQHPS